MKNTFLEINTINSESEKIISLAIEMNSEIINNILLEAKSGTTRFDGPSNNSKFKKIPDEMIFDEPQNHGNVFCFPVN